MTGQLTGNRRRELREVTARLKRYEALVAQIRVQRNELALQALEAGIAPNQVASDLGVSTPLASVRDLARRARLASCDTAVEDLTRTGPEAPAPEGGTW